MSISSKSQSRRHLGGFTLVEVLVAVSLLSIIMVAMGAAMRTMAQTESRIDQRMQRMDDLRVASGFIQQVLGRVSGRKLLAPQGRGGQEVAFRATPTSIEWVGIMPARHGMGGRYFFRLQTEELSTGPSLVLRFSPWQATAMTFPDWSQASARILVPETSQFAVYTEGRPTQNQALQPDWPAGWVPGWPMPDQLPQRVRISWALAGGLAWPDLVVPVRTLTQGAGVGGGFTIGGAS